MCDFCERFDFGSAACEVDRHGARIILAGGIYRFPNEKQFNFCPKCGESREQILARQYLSKRKEGWEHSPCRKIVCFSPNNNISNVVKI